jgi:pyrroline-5-carboxylate reductase
MGSAIANVLKETGKDISVYDIHEERADSLAKSIGVPKATSAWADLFPADCVLLAVKPQDFESVSEGSLEFTGGLVASILTGITIERLKTTFPQCTVLRMMPNLAVRYGNGVVALAEDFHLDPYKKVIEDIFSSLGMLKWFPEYLFDSVTALTGSGPAFVFAVIEAMVDASIALGFSSDVGYDLVKQMVEGALTTLYESPNSPSDLRHQVCSPAGTTIAGICALERNGLRYAIIEAFTAAKERSAQLGKI